MEGPDGVGKTSVSKLVAKELGALWTREPTEWLIPRLADPSWDEYAWHEHALLFSADRSIHLHDVIRPALEAGRTVVCDRYELSTFVYQLVDAGHSSEWTENREAYHARLLRMASTNDTPDVVLVLEVPYNELERRLLQRGTERSYYEQEERLRRVVGLYSCLTSPVRLVNGFRRVDASGSIDEMAGRCLSIIGECDDPRRSVT